MNFRHTFTVEASRAVVAEFHRQAASLAAITPPPVFVRLHRAPERLAEGDEMDVDMWVGPLPIRWRVRIEASDDGGFVDRQVSGPFQQWVHRHSFVPVDAATTEVIDEIELDLRRHALWGPVGAAMWLGLPLLFTYRAWKTRRALAR